MTHQKLILMRHAKSDWEEPAGSDFDRPLAKRGRKDAPHMGAWLKKKGLIPERLLASPARRAKETASLVAEELEFDEGRIEWQERIYDASVDDLLKVIEGAAMETSCLMLIGHNPGLDELLEFLSQDEPQYEDDKLMTTAAIAVLSYGEGPIQTGAKSARLELLVRPR